MASALWEAQPEEEKSTKDKICVACQMNDAVKVCSRCHCTRYCSRDCQKTHWKCHKKYCMADAVYSFKGDVSLPKYRDFTVDIL